VNGQNGVFVALLPAVVDDFLGAALDFGVAALHAVKVQRGGVGAGGHGAGRTATHANFHSGAAELDEQRTGGEFDLFRLPGINHAQTARDHDGLVVAALHTGHGLLVLAEVAQQVGPAKFVVERGPTQWAFGHDLQRAGNVFGLAAGLVRQTAPEFGHGKTREARLGPGAAPGGSFVTNLATRTGRCTRKR